VKTDRARFLQAVAAPLRATEQPEMPQAEAAAAGDHRPVIVLDPGHGGIDPGTEYGGTTEAAVALTFARELADMLRRAGMTVEMTRTEDVFVPLETRISVARAAGADTFLSLHADALAEGEASGATVYRLAGSASDAASEQLAERHDRADLLAGIDLSGHDDVVADVLMDLARTETGPRAARLAEELRLAIGGAGLEMLRRPIQDASFSVLKAADIPSLLLEVGFLSSARDRQRLADPAWRARMQEAILSALRSWAVADAEEARRLRR
ncbi:MAG: N-acetylmuramoyl-L-alanine amidase, partial [Thermoleophilia bacterium]|nr:N-acetylmuramoyl-L-alanine amidase [Thermoleophilia bacterium]